MNIYLKTEDEIELMRRANRLVGRTLAELAKHIKPGVTTSQLDKIAGEFIRDHGAIPTFKDFPNPFGDPFPANICTSVNDVVVHGVPDDKTVLREGDVISIDCGTLLDGFNGDSCYRSQGQQDNYCYWPQDGRQKTGQSTVRSITVSVQDFQAVFLPGKKA